MSQVTKLSFIIPCYRSENTIEAVTKEIIEVVSKKPNYSYEIICVNDCSPDNVMEVLRKIAKENKKIKVINFAKNSGRQNAILAGFAVADGDYFIAMDDDGQCPMDKVWDLIKPLEEGHDVTNAKYTKYKQSFFKSIGTVVNRKMTEIIIEKPKDIEFTNFMAVKKYIAKELIKYKNPYSYMTGLVLRTTGDCVSVPMEERNRLSGTTTYTFKKLIDLWLNGFTAFSVKPLRISMFIGIIIALLGFIYGAYVVINKIINPESILAGYSSIIAILLFIGGTIMILLGLIGEYVGRIYICINNSPQYTIKETINIEDKNEKDK